MDQRALQNVLVVDDSASKRTAIGSVLADLPIRIIEAASGVEALRVLLQEEVAVILLDVNMPGMDGFEVAKICRERPRLKYVPIIFLTAYGSGDIDLAQGYRLGAVDYLFLPIIGEALRSKVQVFIDLAEARTRLEERVADRTRELAALGEELSTIIATSPAAVVALSPDLSVKTWNPMAARITGVATEAATGRCFFDVFPRCVELEDALVRGTAVHGAKIDLPHAEGDALQLVASSVPVWSAERRLAGHICVAQDVTHQEKLARELHHSQKMHAIGQLTGGMAHDFNNLLAVIIGNLDLLKDLMKSNPGGAKLVDACIAAALRGADLTRSLLAFSRRQPLQPETVLMPGILEGIAEMLRRTLGEAISVDIRSAPDVWPVSVDVAMLETAILNICINARDAMPDGGRIAIAVANEHRDEGDAAGNVALAPGDYVKLVISDTGTGIAPEVLERVFEPFFTTKAEGKGTGLGLSMVYGFARQSGGGVEVDSEAGAGTRMSLYLPRAAGQPAARPAGEESKASLAAHGETILVVDDNPFVRQTVVTQIDHLGYRVIEAESAAGALDILEQDQPIDLLFTDVVMPGGMTGTDLAREALKVRPALKVLLTSGVPDLAVAQRLGIGTDGFLGKPYRLRDLTLKIRQVLDA